MDLSLTYVLSQIFVVFVYIFLAVSYIIKDRTKILFVIFGALIFNGAAFILLEAYTGLVMVGVALLRNVIFILDEKIYGKSDKIKLKDTLILLFLIAVTIVCTIFTYDSFLSLMSVFAGVLFTISLWQKNTLVFKGLGIPVEFLWIVYNIYIMSVLGIILESVLALSVIYGFIIALRKSKFKNDKKISDENPNNAEFTVAETLNLEEKRGD